MIAFEFRLLKLLSFSISSNTMLNYLLFLDTFSRNVCRFLFANSPKRCKKKEIRNGNSKKRISRTTRVFTLGQKDLYLAIYSEFTPAQQSDW